MSLPTPQPPQILQALPRLHERELERVERTDAFQRGLLIGNAILTAVYGDGLASEGCAVPGLLTHTKGSDVSTHKRRHGCVEQGRG